MAIASAFALVIAISMQSTRISPSTVHKAHITENVQFNDPWSSSRASLGEISAEHKPRRSIPAGPPNYAQCRDQALRPVLYLRLNCGSATIFSIKRSAVVLSARSKVRPHEFAKTCILSTSVTTIYVVCYSSEVRTYDSCQNDPVWTLPKHVIASFMPSRTTRTELSHF